jgi:hypothetical protein
MRNFRPSDAIERSFMRTMPKRLHGVRHAAARPGAAQIVSVALIAMLTASAAAIQEKPKTAGGPAWKRVVKIADGRSFVTDGSLAIDAAIAKPAVLPAEVLTAGTARLLERYLTARLKDEFALSDLKASGAAGNLAAPSGVLLNAVHIEYLRRTLPASTLRFRMESDVDPVVILADGTAIGVLMPMRR